MEYCGLELGYKISIMPIAYVLCIRSTTGEAVY